MRRSRTVMAWSAAVLALALVGAVLLVRLALGERVVAEWRANQADLVIKAVCVPHSLGADLQLRVHREGSEVARMTLEANLDTRADCKGIGGAPGVEIQGVDRVEGILKVAFSRRTYLLPLVLGGPETARRQVPTDAQ